MTLPRTTTAVLQGTAPHSRRAPSRHAASQSATTPTFQTPSGHWTVSELVGNMVNIWLIYGYCMVNIWLIYGYCMVIVWLMMVNNNLIGGIPIPLKNMTSVGMMTFPAVWKNKKCSKPPTSLHTPTFHREKPWFSCRWLVDDDVPLMDMTGSNMFQICSFIPYDLPWFPAGETKGWESQKSCCQMFFR